MRDMLFPIVWIVIVGAALALVYGRVRAARKQWMEEEEKRRLAIEEGIKTKILLPNGKPACIVCQKMPATETWPVVQHSWLDRVTVLKNLYALTPRYAIKDGAGEDYMFLLCRHDKRMSVQKWNEFLAAKRTQVQAVFSQIEGEIAHMEGGGMLAFLQSQHNRSMERLNEALGGPPRPLLRSVNDEHDAPISLPPMTTEKDERTN